MATLLDEIDALSDTRHDFVHGAMIEHRIGRISVTATMGRILQPHGKKRRKPIKVTTKQITETADSVHQLADRMFDLVQELDAMPQEISNTAQCWLFGMRTMRPSSSGDTLIWQESRLVG